MGKEAGGFCISPIQEMETSTVGPLSFQRPRLKLKTNYKE